uniref:Keratin n=1 Tax=Chrysemys picta bellii TaxID=8478 RepID=A0A8C3PEF5_CHRPI
LHHRKMSCSSLCYPECGVARPSPVSGSCNEPCVRQCPDSEVVIRPSPVVVTLPGPILSTFPQQSEVAAVGAPVVGAECLTCIDTKTPLQDSGNERILKDYKCNLCSP